MTNSSASRPDRPVPDWDLVYRSNSIERLKRDRPPLQVRDELPDIVVRGYEDIPEEDMMRLHWWGLAHDKPKTRTFMVRIKVSGGLPTPAQLLRSALCLSSTWDSGWERARARCSPFRSCSPPHVPYATWRPSTPPA